MCFITASNSGCDSFDMARLFSSASRSGRGGFEAGFVAAVWAFTGILLLISGREPRRDLDGTKSSVSCLTVDQDKSTTYAVLEWSQRSTSPISDKSSPSESPIESIGCVFNLSENIFAMKLDYIRIKNFRSIKDCRIKFDIPCRTLVGINESGKSNVLRALRLLSDRFKISKTSRHSRADQR